MQSKHTTNRPVLKLKPRTRIPPARGATCFWINWRSDGYRPKKRHATLESALAERDRLRLLIPDATFRTFECREMSVPPAASTPE
jgi:hypothetical protein